MRNETDTDEDEKLRQIRETRRWLGWRYDDSQDAPPEPHRVRAEAEADKSHRPTNMTAHPLFVVSPTRRNKLGKYETNWTYATGYAVTIGLLLLCAVLAFMAG